MGDDVSRADIDRARTRFEGRVRRTPLVLSESLTARAGVPVHLKLEQLQTTGSFKLRGATNAIAALSAEESGRGVVGVSTGNHGRGLAHAAKQAGIHCIICMSRLVPNNKVEAIRALGAEVRIVGESQDDAQVEVDRLVAEDGMTMLPPFDHRDVIAGQGTLGLEIVEDLPDVDTVIVPCSGGGLIGGVAIAVKSVLPSAKIVGVTMEHGAAMYESIRAGQPVTVEEVASLADSLGGGIGLDNKLTFDIVRELVDDIVLVSEAEIAAGIRHAYRIEKQVIEGGGAVGIAALLADRIAVDRPTVIVLSGCNIDMDVHLRIVAGDDLSSDDAG